MRVLGIAILLINWLVNGCFAEELKEAKEQPPLTAEQVFLATLKEGMVVGYFDQYWLATQQPVNNGYYRKLVKILGNNRFVVQNFFVGSRHKQSDPVTINNVYELKQNGTLSSIEGSYVTWYENGQKQYALNYASKGMLDGSLQGWYQTGQMKLKGAYKKGSKEGAWVEWYENGRVKSKIYYANDKLNGTYEQWHENGQLAVSGRYLQGMLEGLWVTWGSKGDKVSEGIYQNNKRMGVWSYYLKGKKWAEGNYVNGLQDGVWTYWNSDGTKDREILYQAGKQITGSDK